MTIGEGRCFVVTYRRTKRRLQVRYTMYDNGEGSVGNNKKQESAETLKAIVQSHTHKLWAVMYNSYLLLWVG
jgi:hypothetical protein